MKHYFLKFKSGEQDCEIRPANHRGWRVKNVYPDRLMTLSNGYGNHDRLIKVIRRVVISSDLKQDGIPQWHIDAVERIYGKREEWLIAYV